MAERMLGGLYEGGEYQQAMLEAREEFVAWEKNKKKNRLSDKAKFKAQRLAKLHMLEMKGAAR
jgi:hypothetical protein